MNDNEEHPDVTRDICGVIHVGGLGIEWICVREVHAKVYIRRKTTKRNHKGDLIYSNNPVADKHYMVARWPNRKRVDTET